MRIDDPSVRGRTPGSLGFATGTSSSGRLPGPLGLGGGLFFAPGSTPSVKNAAKVKKTAMPEPVDDHYGRDLHAIDWPLFNPKSKKQKPAFDEVRQSPSILNCPVAAALAALASTESGSEFLTTLVTEIKGKASTSISKATKGKLANPPNTKAISSSRYFTVKLSEGPVIVSDVLYTNDSDRDWSLLYMRDPGGKVVWASIIEKAIAVQIGGYPEFNISDKTANKYWEIITGSAPEAISVDGATSSSAIQKLVRAAVRVPTIAATKEVTSKRVYGAHGYAVLGMKGSKLQLYDPFSVKRLSLSMAEFRADFVALIWQRL